MFIGHFGVAFAAKRFAPKTSLGTLLFAGEMVDLLWPVLLLSGIEHARIVPGITRMTPLDLYDYPISHSLLMVAVWALVGGTGYVLLRRDRKGALVLGAVVLSHWFLDAIVHRPDLPLTISGARMIGGGLWNHVAAAVAIEICIFVGGVILYVRSTEAHDRVGSIGMWSFVVVVLAIYASSVAGPPPPSIEAVAVTGIVGGIVFIAWSAWFDRHRTSRNSNEDHRELFTEKQVGR